MIPDTVLTQRKHTQPSTARNLEAHMAMVGVFISHATHMTAMHAAAPLTAMAMHS
jgi:hypothetical protein